MCVRIFELKFVCEFSSFRSIPSKQDSNTMTGPQELKKQREKKPFIYAISHSRAFFVVEEGRVKVVGGQVLLTLAM